MLTQAYTTLLGQTQAAQVSVERHLYRVDFGPGVRSRVHFVDHQQVCNCELGACCPAVLTVIEYLAEGGQAAISPEPGYYPTVPNACPVCGARCWFDNELSSKRRGAGWRCVQGDSSHYWQAHVSALAERVKTNPWLKQWITAPGDALPVPTAENGGA